MLWSKGVTRFKCKALEEKNRRPKKTWVEVAGKDLHLTMDIILNGRECKMES